MSKKVKVKHWFYDSEWSIHKFQLSNGDEFDVYHNLGDQIQAAFDNWIVRTEEATVESFCKYINDKTGKEMGTFLAFPNNVWAQVLEDYGAKAVLES